MSDHWDPPGPLDGQLEPEVRASYDARAPFYSIAVSLKRIADKLTADDQSPPHPEPIPAGPVINGRVLKAGDRVRFRDGSTGGVASVTAAAPRIYPWSVQVDGVGEFTCTTFGTFRTGDLHHRRDIVEILDDADAEAEPPAEEPQTGPVVDGRTVKVGDVLRFRSGEVCVVRGVVHDGPGTPYPWRIDTDTNGWTSYALGGRYWTPYDGDLHDLDIVGFVDEPEPAPGPAPVDLSQLRPGDVVRFADGSLGLVYDTSDSKHPDGGIDVFYARQGMERSVGGARGWFSTIDASFRCDGKRVHPNSVGSITEIIRGKRNE